MQTSESKYRLGIEQVKNYLPHRAPFLMVDRVLEIHPKGDLTNMAPSSDKIGTTVVAIKNVTYNEPCFAGHFPNFSIFPGVLIVESLAQAASFTIYPYLGSFLAEPGNDLECILVGVDNARFRRPVVPGDTLQLEVELTKCRGKLWAFSAKAKVDGQLVAEADLMANLELKKGKV